ncbi:hypothetical protein [Robiginitalea sp. SC105]|uniref:hypothetical protein n=1 Tax=Robiginitalea sp. SC105 TaxID=2762332 RepID=UPI00163B0DFB|nr:hypothetical protein [Robiginitalea sp. SC105]MBC2840029.1 hypothetical protein [Robiginitalea sp. SC105]
MKINLPHYLMICLFCSVMVGCSKGEDADVNNSNPDPDPDPVESVVYDLTSANDSGVTGTATLIRNSNGTSTILIELENALEGLHPAAVHENSVSEGGPIAITLNDCECQVSETVITQLDDGTSISFDELMVFDGHLLIYQSEQSMDRVIARANIGSNAF